MTPDAPERSAASGTVAFPTPIIPSARLAAALAAPPDGPPRPVVLDVRWRLGGPPARPDHDASHIPGAVFLDLGVDLADPPGPGGRHPLPDPARWQAVLRRAGVRAGGAVVVHDDADGAAAARAWWLLRWSGWAAGSVAVLDGGWAAWTAGGFPVTAEPSSPVPGDAVVVPGAMPVLDLDGAAALADTGRLWDARAAPRYRGEVEPIDPRAGHVPGARNAPYPELTGSDGRWPAPEVLVRRLREWALPGATGGSGETAGVYCGSGVTATSLILAAEYAGLRSADDPLALYAGSWSEWSARADRPVATGPTP